MSQPPIHFFHGLESGPVGTKSTRLSEAFDVTAPDFEGVYDIRQRLETAEDLTEGAEDLVVVGSSFGGLLAALLYARHPDRFHGYVLMAPALHHDIAETIDRMPDNAVVIHGTRDDVVPIEEVRAFCQPHGVEFIEVDDTHRLHEALDLMVESTRRVSQSGA